MDKINNISFTAKPGVKVMQRIAQECNGNEANISKFTNLFQYTFAKNLDKNTVVDIDKNERFIFSHLNFPNIFYKSGIKLDRGRGKDFKSSMIMSCPSLLNSIEHKLIRTIIKKYYFSGISFDKMNKMAELKIENTELKKYFLDNLNIARRIVKEKPDSKLSFDDFDFMEMTIFEELAEIPGTREHELVYGKKFLPLDIK